MEVQDLAWAWERPLMARMGALAMARGHTAAATGGRAMGLGRPMGWGPGLARGAVMAVMGLWGVECTAHSLEGV